MSKLLMAYRISHIANRKSLFAMCYLLFLGGCATTEYMPRPKPSQTVPSQILKVPGTYHRVERGQTLWRISKLYDVDLDEIISANNISDGAQIRTGQTIFIPYKEKKVAAPSPAQSYFQDFIWPAKGNAVSGYGEKTKNIVNKGITLRVYTNYNVRASASGAVVFANENLKGYGKTIIIAHQDGIMTVYALLSHILVKPGDYIQQGAPIAKCENGILHFEIRKGYLPQNPYYYLPG